jgi:cbb3-type cytochrome oxidase maturation protein
MEILYFLIPIALIMSLSALYWFFWCLRNNQFSDPQKAKHSIFTDRVKRKK